MAFAGNGCKGSSASKYEAIQNLVFTASQIGHKQGVVVLTDRRQYTLELQAVQVTKTRLVSWSVSTGAPSCPLRHPGRTLLPTGPRQYHVGFTVTTPGHTPEWLPVQVVADLPMAPSAKIYLRFPPFVLHSRMPLLRGMTEQAPRICSMPANTANGSSSMNSRHGWNYDEEQAQKSSASSLPEVTYAQSTAPRIRRALLGPDLRLGPSP